MSFPSEMLTWTFALNGFVNETGTTAITAASGTYIGAYFPVASVIASATVTGVSGDTLAGASYGAGTMLMGDITAITLTSGAMNLIKR